MINSQNNKKIKVFLGAYVNFPNAQNINCDNIARYLDKDKFEVHVMYTNKMPIDKDYYSAQNVHLHKLIHHRYIWYWSKLLVMLFAHCDIYYLSKMEKADKTFVRIAKKQRQNTVFLSSIEGVVGAQIPQDDEGVRSWFASMDNVFSISKCIQESANLYWNMHTPVLYLGIDLKEVQVIDRNEVSKIIWVGSIIERKHPELLLEIAKTFPELTFTMIGDGDEYESIKTRLQNEGIENVTLTGRLANADVYEILRNSDLLLMTSDKEGLPKVIGEAMAMSVPAIYINKYYDVDYIDNGINGYAVSDTEEMKERISFLLQNPEKYNIISTAAADSIKPYLWPVLIKQYEDYFESLVNTKDER